MSQYLMYLNWWHRNASSAALLSNILSWRKPYHGASPGASHVSRHGARAVRAPSLALSWSKLIYMHTHMNVTVKYIRPSFIHAFTYIFTFIYMFIDTLSRHLLFVLYYCTSFDSILFAYCISSTALHPLSLQVVSGHIVVVLHRLILLYHRYVIIVGTIIHPTHEYQCHILPTTSCYCTTHSDSTIYI